MKSPTDFSNPMYETGTAGGVSTSTNKTNDIGKTNPLADSGENGLHPLEEDFNKQFASAILAPSSTVVRGSPQMKKSSFKPTSRDTDKDTANLVEEDHSET